MAVAAKPLVESIESYFVRFFYLRVHIQNNDFPGFWVECPDWRYEIRFYPLSRRKISHLSPVNFTGIQDLKFAVYWGGIMDKTDMYEAAERKGLWICSLWVL